MEKKAYILEKDAKSLIEEAKQYMTSKSIYNKHIDDDEAFKEVPVYAVEPMTSHELMMLNRRIEKGMDIKAVINNDLISGSFKITKVFERDIKSFSLREWKYIIETFGQAERDSYTMFNVEIDLLDLEPKSVKTKKNIKTDE